MKHSTKNLLDTINRCEREIATLGNISGKNSALLVTELFNHETSPGGPYAINESDMGLLINIKIRNLFRSIHRSLPQVDQYISETIFKYPQKITPEIETLLNKSTQNPLINYSSNFLATNNISLVELGIEELTVSTSPISEEVSLIYDAISRADSKGEISMFSRYFNESLISKNLVIDTSTLTDLGYANFLVWMSYSLYDKAMDDPHNFSHTIPAANILQRRSLELFNSTSLNSTLIKNTFDGVDRANALEAKRCRADISNGHLIIKKIPNNTQLKNLLAERGYGHVLGPLLILEANNYSSKVKSNIRKSLSLYCAAKQLNDDLHDWTEDICSGNITYVVAWLLRKAGINAGSHNLTNILPSLKNIFWESEFNILSKYALNNINEAEMLLKDSGIINEDGPFINQFIKPIADETEQARYRHNSDKEFLLNITTKST